MAKYWSFSGATAPLMKGVRCPGNIPGGIITRDFLQEQPLLTNYQSGEWGFAWRCLHRDPQLLPFKGSIHLFLPAQAETILNCILGALDKSRNNHICGTTISWRQSSSDFRSFQILPSELPKKPMVLKSDQKPKQFYSKYISQKHQTLAGIKQNLEEKLTSQTKSIKGCDDEADKA